MTRDDRFIEQLEAYLDEHEGLTPLPNTLRDAIRAALPTTKQVRPARGLPRFLQMNGFTRYGVAAAVLAVAAIVGFSLFNNQIGRPGPATPMPTSSAETSPEGSPLPDALEGTFLGPIDAGGGPTQTARIRFLSEQFELQAWSGVQFLSLATSTGPNEVRILSVVERECDVGQEGTYTFTLSAGGNLLTLEGDDQCAARGDAINGVVWQRSDCRTRGAFCPGIMAAGTYSSGYFEPRLEGEFEPRFGAFTFTVPEGWAAYADLPDIYGLTPESEYSDFDGGSDGFECYDCPGTRDTITVLSDPGAATEDCGEEGNVPGVGFGAEDLLGWMQSHPGLVVGDVTETRIGGFPARSFTITAASDWTGTCDPENPVIAVPVFYRVDSYAWALIPNQGFGVTLIDIGDGHTVAVMVDVADEADLADLMAEAAPIIATFDFPPR